MISNFGLQASAGFDPRQIPGLIGWWDVAAVNGRDQAQPAEGSVINQWHDISGNGYHLTPPDTYVGPRFEQGAARFYTSHTVRLNSYDLPQLSEVTVFHVYRATIITSSSYSTLLQYGSGDRRISHAPTPTGRHNRARWDKVSDTNMTITGTNTDLTSSHIFTFAGQLQVAGGGEYKSRTDGVFTGSGIFTDPTVATYDGAVGRFANAESDTYTHAILVYSGFMSGNQCLEVERWLGKRFGVAVA